VDPVRVVQDSGGCATTHEVLAHATRWALRKAVETGRLKRAGRAAYVLPELPDALVVAAELGGLASHLSAALLWRLDMVREPDAVHVTVRHGASRAPRAGVVVHRTRHLEADHLHRGRTSLARTVLDCGRRCRSPRRSPSPTARSNTGSRTTSCARALGCAGPPVPAADASPGSQTAAPRMR